MHVPELAPLLDKVQPLKAIATAMDIADFVESAVGRATTPSMGQSACEQIITMCHPKAWGDRQIEGLGADATAWTQFLDDLSQLAEECGQAIYDNNKKA